MAKLRITGLNKGKVREVNINLIQFDRDALTDELADLTLELIDKKLLSSSRDPDPKVKIFLSFADAEIFICHFNGRLLCDLDTYLLEREKLINFDFLEENYLDAYDLIQDVVDHESPNYQKSVLAGLYSMLDESVDELTYEDGSVYKGVMKDGAPHGIGVLNWVDGSMYDGDWIDGQMTGNGTYLWSNGMKYIGDWVNGQMHGKGKLISVDGNVSEGNFSLGKLVN